MQWAFSDQIEPRKIDTKTKNSDDDDNAYNTSKSGFGAYRSVRTARV